MGNTIYYAAMSNNAANQPSFYAGKAESVDLCSVSACFPHVVTYPEANLGGTAETGNVACPATPSVQSPCTITITVNTADVGGPKATDLLEEIGTYAFAGSHPQGLTTVAQAQADNIPLEIDGSCCFNYGLAPNAATPHPVPTGPTSPGLLPLPGARVHLDPATAPSSITW
jgi:hypothetical protein